MTARTIQSDAGADVAARIDAVERAVEWALIADERAGRRAAA